MTFRSTTRMPPNLYKELLDLVTPLISYADTNWRESIKPAERLSLTIRYLTRGDSVTSLYQGYLVGESTVLPLIRDTCRAIYTVLAPEYMKVRKKIYNLFVCINYFLVFKWCKSTVFKQFFGSYSVGDDSGKSF